MTLKGAWSTFKTASAEFARHDVDLQTGTDTVLYLEEQIIFAVLETR